jgi:hypothetical protein
LLQLGLRTPPAAFLLKYSGVTLLGRIFILSVFSLPSTGCFRDFLVDLDLAELGVPIASLAETRNKHPFRDRVYACAIPFCFLQPLGLDFQVQKGGENT